MLGENLKRKENRGWVSLGPPISNPFHYNITQLETVTFSFKRQRLTVKKKTVLTFCDRPNEKVNNVLAIWETSRR